MFQWTYSPNGQQHSSDYDNNQNTYREFGKSAPYTEVFKGNVWNICIMHYFDAEYRNSVTESDPRSENNI